MGGLRHQLPTTWLTMLIAALAISGVPPLAGFFSKDLILEATYRSGYHGLWLLGLLTAGLTSFYMFRLIFLTFYGDSRLTTDRAHHVQESPSIMTAPLLVLAAFSIVAGWVGLPEGWLWGDAFARFLDPVIGHPQFAGGEAPVLALSAIATVVALAGIVVAWIFYLRLPGLPMLLAFKLRGLYTMMSRKYYVDEIYNGLLSQPLFWLSANVFHRGVDVALIDGLVDGTGLTVEGSGDPAQRTDFRAVARRSRDSFAERGARDLAIGIYFFTDPARAQRLFVRRVRARTSGLSIRRAV